MNITLTFNPLPDITAYELALCLPYAPNFTGYAQFPAVLNRIPKEVFRHFDCIYDPNNEDSARWVREVFLPNRVAHQTVQV